MMSSITDTAPVRVCSLFNFYPVTCCMECPKHHNVRTHMCTCISLLVTIENKYWMKVVQNVNLNRVPVEKGKCASRESSFFVLHAPPSVQGKVSKWNQNDPEYLMCDYHPYRPHDKTIKYNAGKHIPHYSWHYSRDANISGQLSLVKKPTFFIQQLSTQYAKR